jgi:hypothetical protein
MTMLWGVLSPLLFWYSEKKGDDDVPAKGPRKPHDAFIDKK